MKKLSPWEQQVLDFAQAKGEPWSIYAAMENWRERAQKAERDTGLMEKQREIIANLRVEKNELREQAVAALRKATGKAFRECEDMLATAYAVTP